MGWNPDGLPAVGEVLGMTWRCREKAAPLSLENSGVVLAIRDSVRVTGWPQRVRSCGARSRNVQEPAPGVKDGRLVCASAHSPGPLERACPVPLHGLLCRAVMLTLALALSPDLGRLWSPSYSG